jgi:predicted nucleic acid-binding protein
MKKLKIYVESSTISYLTARPTEEPIRKAKQILTHRWWEKRNFFELFISESVIEEIRHGDPKAASLRTQSVEGIPVLSLIDQVQRLAKTLLLLDVVPQNEEQDAFHIAYAAVYEMDYLLTWNQKHIANQQKRRQLEEIILGLHLKTPYITTPEQFLLLENLMEEDKI